MTKKTVRRHDTTTPRTAPPNSENPKIDSGKTFISKTLCLKKGFLGGLGGLGALAVIIACALPLRAQQLTSGADFLTIDSGARSEGMGEAFTAMADDVTALTWNPAGIALLSRPQVAYLHMLYLSSIGYNFGGVVVPLPAGEDSFGLGAGMVNLGTGSFDSTLGVAPAVSAGNNAFLLSFAFRVKKAISFGVTGKYILEDLAGYNASAFGGDAGVLITPGDRFRIGLGIFNFGQQIQFISAADPLPLSGRLGLAWKMIDVPHNTLTLSADNGWQFGSQTYTGAAGAEYWLDRVLALRAGYTGDSYQQHPTAGIGINVDPVEFDYAFSPQETLGDTHRFSLTLSFGSEAVEGLVAPTGFSAIPADGAISLHWKPVPSNVVVGYNIYVRKPNTEGMILVTKRPLGIGELSVRLNHLSNGQSYTFAVASVSAAGRESSLATLAAVPVAAEVPSTPTPTPGLAAPTGFKATAKAAGFDLTWDKAISPMVTGFNLYLADAPGKPVRKLSPVPITDNIAVIKKVNPHKTYCFLLTSVDKTEKESAAATLTANFSDLEKAQWAAMNPPPAHLLLEVNGAKVKLSWDSAGVGKVYNVYVSHDGVNYRLLTPTGTVKTQAVLGPLKPNMAYYFGVTTLTSDGKETDKAIQSLPASSTSDSALQSLPASTPVSKAAQPLPTSTPVSKGTQPSSSSSTTDSTGGP